MIWRQCISFCVLSVWVSSAANWEGTDKLWPGKEIQKILIMWQFSKIWLLLSLVQGINEGTCLSVLLNLMEQLFRKRALLILMDVNWINVWLVKVCLMWPLRRSVQRQSIFQEYLIFSMRKLRIVATSLVQWHSDCDCLTCCSGPINRTKDQLPKAQNKLQRVGLNLNPRTHTSSNHF